MRPETGVDTVKHNQHQVMAHRSTLTQFCRIEDATKVKRWARRRYIARQMINERIEGDALNGAPRGSRTHRWNEPRGHIEVLRFNAERCPPKPHRAMRTGTRWHMGMASYCDVKSLQRVR